MTAQIGILNKKAIVLATDSAVTIKTGDNEEKVYNSVNKLFSLSKTKPLGIMVYGNAELLEAPWETIIKVYRKDQKKDFKTLQQYAMNFIGWLEKNAKKIFPESIQKDFFQHSIISYYNFILINVIHKEIEEMEKAGDKLDKKKILTSFKKKITQEYDKLNKEKYISNFDDDFVKDILKTYKKEISYVIKNMFGNLKLGTSDIAKLTKIAAYYFVKAVFSDNYSGVVIAGFGDEEFYPSLFEYQIEGVVNNKIKYKIINTHSIKSDGMTALVLPFAQDDVIKNFMNGIHPQTSNLLKDIFKLYPEMILEKMGVKGKKKIALRKSLQSTNNAILNECQKQSKAFSDPIIRMISLMPISEMCHFAESLVNLTSLRKKVTMQTESVGGETEVVSITKGEGLIWIKRKHYFDPKLNNAFSSNYLNI